jgi:hypothetical protein
MTNYLYTINAGEDFNLDLKYTTNYEVIKKEILKVIHDFEENTIDCIFYIDNNFHEDYKIYYITNKIRDSLNNNTNMNIQIHSECSDYYLNFNIINKKITLDIVMFDVPNYYYTIKTIDLDNKKLQEGLI